MAAVSATHEYLFVWNRAWHRFEVRYWVEPPGADDADAPADLSECDGAISAVTAEAYQTHLRVTFPGANFLVERRRGRNWQDVAERFLPALICLRETDEPGAALYDDGRCGFSMIIPGAPRWSARAPAPGEPTYEALVEVTEVPIELGFRRGEAPEGVERAPLAIALAQAYARNRSGEAPAVEALPGAQTSAWGVEAAATALYHLRAPVGRGADVEVLTVLVRSHHQMTVTRRFSTASVDWRRWALFNAATMSSLRWDPGMRPRPQRLWPPSSFLEPGLMGQLRASARERLRPLLALVTTPAPGLYALRRRLQQVLRGGEAPSAPVTAEIRASVGRFLCEVCLEPALEDLIKQGLAEVETGFDLRGLSQLLLEELPGGPDESEARG